MHDHDDLSVGERDALDRLPRERRPPRALEQRVVDALRRDGLLRAPAPLHLPLTPVWVATAAAACVALFVGGVAMGGWMESRHTTSVLVQMHQQEAASAAAAAAEVQRTGSAYVAALSALAAYADSSRSPSLTQGREVAVTALHAAANQLVRLAPEDPVVVKLLQAMDRGAGGDTAAYAAASPRRTAWY